MSLFNLAATAAFGLESIVADELRRLGVENISIENGKVNFTGDYGTIIDANLWLRCADRVFIQLAVFRASDWDELFDGTKSVPWENIIPENGMMHVVGKSVKSKLHSVPDCQSIVKKAVVESMKRKYRRDIFPEDGPVYKIEISILNDNATLSIDTSGAGLNRRGYRTLQGEAPLRETLAAALVYLSKWGPGRVLADPFCGSGTIPIEAAMIGRNIAPGLLRSFASETWNEIPSKMWKNRREAAREAMSNRHLEISASDINKDVFRYSVANAEKAGVTDCILFQRKPLLEFSSRKKYGCVICNPPYGERLGEKREAALLYREMGRVFSSLDSWSFFILTASEEFEKDFGKKSDKNRKLYNGKIKTRLYQYYGPLPERGGR